MDEQNTDIHELGGKTPEFRTQLAKQLEDLVPEAIADGKVDVLKLKELLDEDAGDTAERFGLFWPGKKRAMRAAQDPTTATLKPAKSESKDWDTSENIFIEGDNLEVLKVLQKQYHNSIKMIYIDPPYNTGKDFVYPDNFKEGLQNYLEFSKQVDEGNKKISTNTETAGRYHSNWLNMMYPRLKLARNLLTDDGVIFISIDDAEQGNLRKICEEVFGEQNVELMIWNKIGTGSSSEKMKIIKRMRRDHEYILCCYRNVDRALFNKIRVKREYKQKLVNKDNDPRGEYKLGSIARSEELSNPNSKNYYTVKSPTGKEWTRQFLKPYDEFQSLDNDGRIFWGNDGSQTPSIKIYGNEMGEIYLSSILLDYGSATLENKRLVNLFNSDETPFSNPKPIKLIKLLLQVIPDNNLTVLDFFSGSGTTAHAVMQLNAEDGGNRKHIQVQLPEPTDEKSEAYKAGYRKISDIARERINRAGEKIKADFADKLAKRDTPLDVGYRTYKLSDTNFTKWKSEATNDLGELQLRLDAMRSSSDDNASEEDLLVEVMVKLGLPLTSRTIEREVSGLTVHQVVASANLDESDTQPVFYLNEHIKPTLEQLRAIVTELTPSRFVILDDAFRGDSQLKTNLVQTCKSYDVELWTV